MEAANPFRMVVEDVFDIRGKGIAVTGRISEGSITTGEDVLVEGLQTRRRARVLGLIESTKTIPIAAAPMSVGILLDLTKRDDVKRGDTVRGMSLDEPATFPPSA